jgi:hypothetical protein
MLYENFAKRLEHFRLSCVYMSVGISHGELEMSQKTQETTAAVIASIISSIGAEKVSVGVEPSGVLTVEIRKDGWKLERLVLSAPALDALRRDPDRAIKLAYLNREIEQASARRSAWYYPRLLRYAVGDAVKPPTVVRELDRLSTPASVQLHASPCRYPKRVAQQAGE